MNKDNQLQYESDDDNIIENDDDYEEESLNNNTNPNDNEREMLYFENESNQDILIKAHFDKEDKAIELLLDIDIELPYDTMFLPIKKYLSDEDEEKYIKRIEDLIKDNQGLKDHNDTLSQNQIELKLKNESDEKKNDDNIEINQEIEISHFEKSKADLEDKINKRNNEEKTLVTTNKELQLTIDNYLKEFNLLREDMTIKSNAILEKQRKILQLDKDSLILGAKSVSHLNSTVKKNETINQIKSRTTSVMTQLTKANSQISKLVRENDLLKERIELIKQQQSGTLKAFSPNQLYNNVYDQEPNDDDINDDYIEINQETTSKSSNKSISSQSITKTVCNNSNNKIPHRSIISEGNTLSTNTNTTFSNKKATNATTTTTMNIFPCQQEMVKRERKILEIESILYKLQKERDLLNDNLLKLPEFPKQKAQINEKRALELSISEFNTKINNQKQQLRELNKVS